MITISALIFGSLSLFFYSQEKANITNGFSSEGALHVDIQKQIIGHEFDGIVQSLMFLEDQVEFHYAFVDDNGAKQVEDDLFSYMKASASLDQVRLINVEGHEVIRVNYHGGAPTVVTKEALQQKGHRYYISEIMKLQSGEFYISTLDLNKEHGEVEIPHKPVIRFGMGVYDQQGIRVGSIIANYLANEMLGILKKSGALSSGDFMLLNGDGYYLSAPDPKKEWGFMFADGVANSLAFEVSEVWGRLSSSDSGAFSMDDALYVYSSVYPYDEMLKNKHTKPEMLSGHAWKIVGYYGPEHFDMAMAPYRKALLQWAALFGGFLLFAAWPVAAFLERRKLMNDYLVLLSNAIEHAGEAISVTDADGVFEYVNPAFVELTGYAPDEAVGRKPSEILKSTAQNSDYYKELWQTISKGEVWHGKLIDKKKDGSFYPATISISPVQDKKGIITNYIAIQNDASDSQRLLEKEMREEKMKTLATAIGGIAHEFNNILTGMLGNVFLLKSKGGGDEYASSKLNSIEHLGNRAAGMVDQMLVYVGNEIQPHAFTSIDINNLYREVVFDLKTRVPEEICCSAEFQDGGEFSKVQESHPILLISNLFCPRTI